MVKEEDSGFPFIDLLIVLKVQQLHFLSAEYCAC